MDERTICDYEPTERYTEFRVLGYNLRISKNGHSVEYGKARKLETLLSHCVGALTVREGRYLRIQADLYSGKKEIEQQKKQERAG